MRNLLQRLIRETVSEFNENLVTKADDLDIASPEANYVRLQRLVGQHGTPTPDGLTMRMNNPVGDIVAVTLQKDGGAFDLFAVDANGARRRLDANSLLDPQKAAELSALCNEITLQMEGVQHKN
jgi:hypothetical protein